MKFRYWSFSPRGSTEVMGLIALPCAHPALNPKLIYSVLVVTPWRADAVRLSPFSCEQHFFVNKCLFFVKNPSASCPFAPLQGSSSWGCLDKITHTWGVSLLANPCRCKSLGITNPSIIFLAPSVSNPMRVLFKVPVQSVGVRMLRLTPKTCQFITHPLTSGVHDLVLPLQPSSASCFIGFFDQQLFFLPFSFYESYVEVKGQIIGHC